MVNLSQPSFSSGELTPLAHGRTDLARYATGLKKCKNWIIRPHGCLVNRYGSRFVSATKNADERSILVPFEFSDTVSYMLEFGDSYIRIYSNGARVFNTVSVAISNVVFVTAGPVGTIVTTATPHGLSVDDVAFISGVIGTDDMSFVVNNSFAVAQVDSATVFRVLRKSLWNGIYTSGGSVTRQQEIISPYTEDDLGSLQFTQSADVLTVVSPNFPQYELVRESATQFTFSQINYEDGPFEDINSDKSVLVYASASSGTVTLTATGNIFAADRVGGLFYLEQQYIDDVQPWEPNKLLVGGSSSALGLIRRNDGKTYKLVAAASSSSGTATGSIPPTHDSGVEMDGDGGKISSFADVVGVSWLYLDSGFGVIRLTSYTSPTQMTGVVLRNLPDTVVGGYTTAHGPYTFSGDGSTKVFSPLTGNDTTNPAKYVVTVGGVLQDPATYTVTQPGGAITFVAAPASGTSNVVVTQISANKRSFLWAFGAWSDHNGYPRTVNYFDDRQFFAGTVLEPQTIWASVTSKYTSFATSVPTIDTDALTFKLNARKVNPIVDLISLESLIAGTSSTIWRMTSGADEVLTPTTVGFKPQNFLGEYSVRSVTIGDSAVYIQKDGRRIRDLIFSFQIDKFSGSELSLLAEHLFPQNTAITKLDYAETPFSLVHCVRSDGIVPTLSYLREQEVLGWSTFETLGEYKDCQSIPENGEIATYTIVRRTINGSPVRYIERFASREFDDIRDAFFVDCGLTYDGRNTDVTTATLTGGTLWNSTEALTLTFSGFAPIVNSSDIGNHIQLFTEDGALIRLKITGVSTFITCTVVPLGTVPAELRNLATTSWARAVDELTGLDHLEGESVSILADGMVVDPQTVTDGAVTLAYPAAVVHVGLPFDSELETLDVNLPGAPSVRNKPKIIAEVTALVYQTRGVEMGPDEDHLDELPEREYEDLNQPVNLTTGIMQQSIRTSIDKDGHVFLKQSQPLPATVLAMIPDVQFGE